MSLFNGDKARAHRRRKQNIQRRLRTPGLVQAEVVKSKPAGRKVKSGIRHQPAAQ